ncbi:MAG: hypothetical protein ACRD8W_32235 [Nitrososphaeraceae archaeon]
MLVRNPYLKELELTPRYWKLDYHIKTKTQWQTNWILKLSVHDVKMSWSSSQNSIISHTTVIAAD